MAENTCKICVFFMTNPETRETSWSEAAVGQRGYCRRYPPSVLWIDSPNTPDPSMRADLHSFQPMVHGDMWCGEFKSKGAGKSKGKAKSKK